MPELVTNLQAGEDERLLQAEAVVRDFCGWHIAPVRTQSVVLHGLGASSLLLPSLYVTGVVSVVQGDGTEVDPEHYEWTKGGVLRPKGGLTWWHYFSHPWHLRTDPVTVTFTHGYEQPPPPVTAVVQAVAQRAMDNPRSLVREQAGPFSETYSQTGFNQSLPIALLAAEKELLAPYALPKRL